MRIVKLPAIAILFLFGICAIVLILAKVRDGRQGALLAWGSGDSEERARLITTQEAACPGAPFILPAEGFFGLLYGDPRGPYSRARPHQGIDIFSDAEPGVAPVYAAYDGYATRESDWRSSIILRIPEDPLVPERQIWLYYTHMADKAGNDFIVESIPQGTREQYVPQGTLLGYTGNYNGNSARGIWVHLHFSIVKDDGNGHYTSELDFDNSVDPSPYLGINVSYDCPSPGDCENVASCET